MEIDSLPKFAEYFIQLIIFQVVTKSYNFSIHRFENSLHLNFLNAKYTKNCGFTKNKQDIIFYDKDIFLNIRLKKTQYINKKMLKTNFGNLLHHTSQPILSRQLNNWLLSTWTTKKGCFVLC